MSAQNKEVLSKWLPVIVALAGFVGNISYISRWGGSVETRLAAVEQHATSTALHMPMERKLELFVARTEFNGARATADAQMSELKTSVHNIDAKLDRLIERGLKNGTN